MYLTELEGLTKGASDAGCPMCGVYVTRNYAGALKPA